MKKDLLFAGIVSASNTYQCHAAFFLGGRYRFRSALPTKKKPLDDDINDLLKYESSRDVQNALGMDTRKEPPVKSESQSYLSKLDQGPEELPKNRIGKTSEETIKKAKEKLAGLSQQIFQGKIDAADTLGEKLVTFQEEMTNAAQAVEGNAQSEMTEASNQTKSDADNLKTPDALRASLDSLRREISSYASEVVKATTNVTSKFVELASTTEAKPIKTTANQTDLFFYVGKKVSGSTLGGAAITVTSLSLIQGGGIALSAAAGLGAALLAASEGLPGDTMRQLGDMAWDIGRRVLRLSQDPDVSDGIIKINSAVLERTTDFLKERGDNTSNKQQISIDDQMRDLNELARAVYDFFDEFNNELERLENAVYQSSSQYRMELKVLETEVQQLMREVQRSIEKGDPSTSTTATVSRQDPLGNEVERSRSDEIEGTASGNEMYFTSSGYGQAANRQQSSQKGQQQSTKRKPPFFASKRPKGTRPIHR